MSFTQADVTPEGIQSLYDEAVRLVIVHRRASISHLQRELDLGTYVLAAAFLEQMEQHGIVSSMTALGSRELLVGKAPNLLEKLLGHKPNIELPSTLLNEDDLARLLSAAGRHVRQIAEREEDGATAFTSQEWPGSTAADNDDDDDAATGDYEANQLPSAPCPADDRRPVKAPSAKPKEPQFRRDPISAGGQIVGYYVTRTSGQQKTIDLQNARREVLGVYKEHTNCTVDAKGKLLGNGNLLVTLGGQLTKPKR